MKIGKVTARVTLGQCAQCLRNETVLQVELEGSGIFCLDRAGAKPGDRVLVVVGHAAGRYSMETPADAVAVAVVE